MKTRRLSRRITIAISATVAVALLTTAAALRLARALEMPEGPAWALALLVTVPVILVVARRVSRHVTGALEGLDNALRALRDSDFSMRLAAPEGDEIAEVKRLYNDVADVLRAQRNDIYQKELLLDTILQRTPVGVVLVNAADRVVYSNVAARELLAGGNRIDGHRFADIGERVAEPVREALYAIADAIITIPAPMPGNVQEETFHVSHRTFRLNTQEHRLVLVERLTAELRRQEVAVWKKAIRVINHEINNTIAPVSSLFHSARLAQQRPEQQHKLDDIYETIDERLSYLRAFLESYAQFARLPAPRREPARWAELLADVRALYDFQSEIDPRAAADIDRAQIQQVLINLVKNAHESGSARDRIRVAIQRTTDGTLIRVTDAGRGMSADVLRQALIPFYSTKPGGSGVGLALSNEIVEAHGGRMRIEAREGGGTVVTAWIPGG